MAEPGVNVVPLRRPLDNGDPTAALETPFVPVEVPRARRPGWPTLAALAIVTGLLAVGLGAWSVYAESSSTPSSGEDAAVERSLAVLADSTAVRYPLRGSVGRVALVVTDRGDAVIALDGLGPAPAGRTYRVWVIARGSATPVADAAFDGSSPVVALERRLPSGTRVAVTLEHPDRTLAPSRPLRLSVVRP